MEECQYGNEKIGKYIISDTLIRHKSNKRNGSDNGGKSDQSNQSMFIAIVGRQVEIYFGWRVDQRGIFKVEIHEHFFGDGLKRNSLFVLYT